MSAQLKVPRRYRRFPRRKGEFGRKEAELKFLSLAATHSWPDQLLSADHHRAPAIFQSHARAELRSRHHPHRRFVRLRGFGDLSPAGPRVGSIERKINLARGA